MIKHFSKRSLQQFLNHTLFHINKYSLGRSHTTNSKNIHTFQSTTYSGFQMLNLSLSISQWNVTTTAMSSIHITEETAQRLIIHTILQQGKHIILPLFSYDSNNALLAKEPNYQHVYILLIHLFTLLHCACSLNARSQNLQPIWKITCSNKSSRDTLPLT